MDSREILPDTEVVRFLLDTESLDPKISGEFSSVEKFLRYKGYNDFSYIRAPGQAESEILRDIDPYEREVDSRENRQTVRWGSKNQNVHTGRYLLTLYQRLAKKVDWNKPRVSVDELEFIDLFSELTGRRKGRVDILVTAAPSLLKNRRLLEYQLCRHQQDRIHVMTPSEASEFAGIYMRKNNDFIFFTSHDRISTYTIDFTLWYWALPRVFIQHFSADEKGYLGSMLDRFQSLFIGIDKLGGQYFRGTGNHTDMMTRYHFNNGVSLLTGICDVLALHTRDKYDIDIEERNTNLRTGKHPLLKELRTHNKEAWQHVHDNCEIIELLHTVRNDVIHQSGVIKRGPGFSLREHDETVEWRSQAVSMEALDENDRNRFRKYYNELGDSVKEYDPVTEWGIVTTEDAPPQVSQHTHIEPYQFLKQATKEIAEFTDEYLRLLGHPNRLKTSPDSGVISKGQVQRIAEHGLFPLLEQEHIESIP